MKPINAMKLLPHQSPRFLPWLLISSWAGLLAPWGAGAAVSIFTSNTVITNTSYDGQDIVISGCTVTANGSHGFNSLLVTNGGVLTHSAATTAQEFSLQLTLTSALVVDATSAIDVSGKGYLPGYTAGNTVQGTNVGNPAGGSYGGLGSAPGGSATDVYGDYRNPNELGSGGNSHGGTDHGYSGGGLVRLTAGGARIDGAIKADGLSSGGGNWLPAGGSGGGIMLNVGTLAGGGSISANGGTGSGITPASGGGGRVAIYYGANDGFDLEGKVSAHGGGVISASVGTVYLKAAGGPGMLRLDNHGTAVGVWTPLGQPTDTAFEVETLVISGTNVVAAPQHQMPVQANNVTIQNGGVLTHQATTTAQEYSLHLTVTNTLVVDATSAIDVSGKGYLPGYTVGNTVQGTNVGNPAGGSYGGRGGVWSGNANAVYGDYHNPNELGSGGNSHGYTDHGYSGGGLVRISAGDATIDGAIRANGPDTGWGAWGAAAGSGGGIMLDVGTLAGGGSISANGGTAFGVTQASGGGGRVAVYYGLNTGFDVLGQVTAHGGGAAAPASVGSVYLKTANGEGVLRIDNHGAAVGGWTPLGLATDTVFQVETLVISGTNVVVAPEHLMTVQANNMSIQTGGVLTHQATTPSQEYSLRLKVASNLVVDATSAIDVSGKGYLPGYTVGNTVQGPAVGNVAGGSYGGLGSAQSLKATDVYGDYHNPNELGSGGKGGNACTSGGGLVRIEAGAITLDGAIRADGPDAPGGGAWAAGGSGGGIVLNVGKLGGGGSISAHGGAGYGIAPASGGGGRVAIYIWGDGMTLPSANVTANGGTGPLPGSAGTVWISSQPWFGFDGVPHFWHGSEPIGWFALGVSPSDLVQVTLSAAGATVDNLVAAAGGAANWNTAAFPDGNYALSLVLRDASGVQIGQIAQGELINNSVIWHGGVVAANETWAAGTVHVIDQSVVIPAGVTVTIQPGAIVKFARATGITIQGGGVLNALATTDAHIVLTSLADDAAGGDSNLDGNYSKPEPGDWAGIAVAGGQFNQSPYVELRYNSQPHGGVLAASETWLGTMVHLVNSDVTVPTGVTLTIEPGAVVKFTPGTGLTVAAGGSLNVPGTVASPITFTSLNDDSVGGDSNGDGGATSPAAGDWNSISISGQAALDHVAIRYGGGGNGVTSGLIASEGGSSVSISDSELSDGFYHGVRAGGLVTIQNCVITGCDRGVKAEGSAQVVNCTLNNNRLGLVVHCGSLSVANTIVANSLEAGVEWDCGTLASMRYCDVWGLPSTNYTNYRGLADQTGQNGNLSADPKFVSADRSNYRLAYRSPCIDAADTTVAPLTDSMGASRYNDPRTLVKTGLANTNGVYADMGAFEFVETAPSDVDLVVNSIQGPVAVQAGDEVTIQWTDSNVGSGSANGPWQDTISLVPVGGSSTNALWAADVSIGQGLVLGTGQSYEASATIRVPGGIEGDYRWQVQCNSAGDVFEGVNWTNNTALAASRVSLTVPTLTINGPGFTNRFVAANQPFWFKLVPAAGTDVQVSLNSASGNPVELFVGRGFIPSAQHFDEHQDQWNAAAVSALIPGASSQPCYVVVYPDSLSTGLDTFTIQATVLDFTLSGVSPATIGNSGPVTLKLAGGRLREDMTYTLIDPAGTGHRAGSVQATDSSTVYATFDATGLLLGSYSVAVNDGVNIRSLARAVSVVLGQPGEVTYMLSMPGFARWDRPVRAALTYANAGTTDATAPIITVSAVNCAIMEVLAGGLNSVDFSQIHLPAGSVQLMAINQEGPAGVLPPGAQGTFYFDLVANPGAGSVSLDVEELDLTPAIDWASITNSIAFFPTDAWAAVSANLADSLGSTAGQYNRVLAGHATYLSHLGEYTADVGRLLGLEFNRANAFGAIGARYALGAFGRGLGDPFNMSAQADAGGNVRIGCPTGFRAFYHQADGSFLATPGDHGVLTAVTGGGYQLQEPDGFIYSFGTQGKINSMKLASGYQITLNYVGGRLASLSDSYGDMGTYAYNAQGRISSLTDRVGRVDSFTYDASGEHLVQVTSPAGTYAISYISGQGLAREHAVSSIAYPDGRHVQFEYDSRGRLVKQQADQGIDPLTYSYDDHASITAVNPDGTSQLSQYDDRMNRCVYRDALGRIQRRYFDLVGNLFRILDPDGNEARFDHDGQGNLTTFTDQLGRTWAMRYNADNLATSLINAAGVPVSFSYNPQRMATKALFADQSAQVFTYNSLGKITSRTNRRGHVVHYSRDAHDLITREDFSDGSHVDFTYDAHRNLSSASGPQGTTSFAYDSADRLIKVTYASGRWLALQHDAAGRRTRVETDDGYAVNYAYDAAGRLASVTNGLGQLVVQYSYATSGQLAREDKGNLTHTIYQYDSSGQLTNLVNFASDGTVASQFEYRYDNPGRPSAVVSLEGAWSYSYDANSQLTHAVFLSSTTNLPNQDFSVYYDRLGNRVQTVVNGVTTGYQSDVMDRYSSVGSTQYAYDADGNLTSITDSNGVSTLTYDDFNHLVSLTSPAGSWTFEYDPVGFRVASIHNGVRTDSLVDPVQGSMLAEYQGGVAQAHYVYGIGLAARLEPAGAPDYYNFDLDGSTVQMTGSGGKELNHYLYGPFGDLLASQRSVPNPFTFAGKWGAIDDGNGLLRMGARYYRPGEGRFITEEPLGRRLPNAYAYAFNSPIALVDPVGLDSQPAQPAPDNFLDSVLNKFLFGLVDAAKKGIARGKIRNEMFQRDYSTASDQDTSDTQDCNSGIIPSLAQLQEVVVKGEIKVVSAGFGEGEHAVEDGAKLAEALGKGGIKWGFPGGGDSGGGPTGAAPGGGSGSGGGGGGFGGGAGDGSSGGSAGGVGGGAGRTKGPGATAPGGSKKKKGGGTSPSGGSTDPNSLTGPAGNWISDDQALLYTVSFENLPTVSLPAQSVVITNYLDPNLDWSTFQFQEIAFNNVVIQMPLGVQSFATNALVGTDPNPVQVSMALDAKTGLVTVTLLSVSPVTGQLVTDPLAGFLPPDSSPPAGEGYFSYVVRPKPGLPSGALIRDQAEIVFDVNNPIPTPTVTNAIDAGAPTSHVLPLPAQSGTSFMVQWTGQDNPGGSGIASYDIFVSHNSATYAAWLVSTTNDSAVFTGASGDSYSFYSIAHDDVGNVERKLPTAEAQTTVIDVPSLSLTLAEGWVFLSWPARFEGFVLEATSSLSPAAWVQTTNQVVLVGDENIVIVTAPTGKKFYRLRR